MPNTRQQAGFIYLLHWQDRQGRVEHYIGWTTDLEVRLKQHFSESGGCPTTRRYRRGGMGGRFVRLWQGTMQGERWLQQTLRFPKDCPICSGKTVREVTCEGWIDAESSPEELNSACLHDQTAGQNLSLTGGAR